MLTVRTIPIFEDEVFITAAKEHDAIWAEYASPILASFLKITGLTFEEHRIAAVVYKGVSYSGKTVDDVMKLRDSYDYDVKKGTLVHELGHRLIRQLVNRKEGIDEHHTLFLFLYDVWVDLWGTDFADRMVEIESKRIGVYDYKKAWNFALELSKEERMNLFEEIKGLN